jgi:CRP-like cAMP-binding protein
MTKAKLDEHLGARGVLKMSGLISKPSLIQLNKLAGLATEVEFKPEEIIITAQHPATTLYVIEEGLVAILLGLGSGRELQIQTASKNDIIGWSAILPQYRYQSMVRAIEKTRVLAFDGKELRSLCQDDHDLGYAIYSGIIGIVAKRLQNTYLQLAGIT